MKKFGFSILFLALSFSACTKKEEPAASSPVVQEPEAPVAESAAENIEPSNEPEDSGAAEPMAGAEPQAVESTQEPKPADAGAKRAPRVRTGLEVDRSLINQRVDTYQNDMAAFDEKLKKFLEVNERFKGEAPDYEIDFDLAKEAFDEERARFESLIANPLESPTRIQWENQERQWASEWMNLIRSFNDIEALYEKQYQGLK